MRTSVAVVLVASLWCWLGQPCGVAGQEIPADGPERQPAAVEGVERTGFTGIIGVRPDRRRAILGLWSMHPYEPQFPELDWTRGGGVQFSQWFMATFINSYDDRSIILGLERYWFTGRASVMKFGFGYRAGLLTGYDERLMALAKYTPVLPFGGVLGWVDIGPVALDTFYVWRALTVEAAIRF